MATGVPPVSSPLLQGFVFCEEVMVAVVTVWVAVVRLVKQVSDVIMPEYAKLVLESGLARL